MITGYVAAFKRPDGRWGVVADARGRLIVSQHRELMIVFAAALEHRAELPIAVVQRDPAQIGALILNGHVAVEDPTDLMSFIEVGVSDEEDAMFRAKDMANAVPLDTVGDWHAAHAGARA